MEDFEKKIEEAAEKYVKDNHYENDGLDLYADWAKTDFIRGAKSPEAKEYWQQGMYTEASVRTMCSDAWISGIEKTYSPSAKMGFSGWFEEYKKK